MKSLNALWMWPGSREILKKKQYFSFEAPKKPQGERS